MDIDYKDIIIFKALATASEPIHTFALYRTYNLSPIEISQFYWKYKDLYIYVDDELKVSLTTEGRLYYSTKLKEMTSIQKKDENGQTFEEQIKCTQIGMYDPFIPDKEFANVFNRTKGRVRGN